LIIPTLWSESKQNGENCNCTKGKKRVKYEQNYRVEYRDKFKCINKSSLGNTFAFCNLCRCDINIAQGGRDDLRKHCATVKHD